MPFEVFRKHQRTLLAVFALLAMISFVLSDVFTKYQNSSNNIRDREVATIYGKTIYDSTLIDLRNERMTANVFFSTLSSMIYSRELQRYVSQTYFGGLSTRDLIDALILEHEADRLGIPGGVEEGKKWLEQVTERRMTSELFEGILRTFNHRVSGEQVLAAIGNQLRLKNVRGLIGSPMVSPYDVFTAYRDQNERVSDKLVEVPVDKFLGKVAEPSAEEVTSYYEKFKNVLPNPVSETPGFMVPRQIQVEIYSIDYNVVARELKDQLTEDEIRSAYENRKSEFEIHGSGDDLPDAVFADQPELTPPPLRPFDEVRTQLAIALADEKAQVEVADRFARIQDKALVPFAVKYGAVLDENEDARKQGAKVFAPLPDPTQSTQDAKQLAAKEGLTFKLSPLLSREQAEHYDLISNAEMGLSMLSGGRKFAEQFFDAKTPVFEPEELSDSRGIGMKYLVRKVQDVPPRVPPLDEVRSQVVLAWKTAQARILAEKAANELAAQIKKKGATLAEPTIDGYRVVTIPPLARLTVTFKFNQMAPGEPEQTPLAEVPNAGEAFRTAYFGLKPGDVAVAPNLPKTIYYVMTLDHRDPATFAALYAPNGDQFRYKNLTQDHAGRQLDKQWMGWLRQQAGLPANWAPPEETKGDASAPEA